ncbi:amidohydrolase [Aquabacterium sp.]|uniref:amidohydrolase n=1 Tax=Aquabacterium sp. TaxID=1872578 RepID=UPI002BC6C026|nr:amidohydrolase [Aquabacterium sp.]HSW05140.1 amidohydrolase [Aquabacterium sp.]
MRFGFIVALALTLLQGGLAAAQPAELIVHNAKVTTLDAKGSVAQALAVRDGRIIGVGDNATVQRLAGAGTRSIDAGGRNLIPGLIDSHMHGVRAALSYSTEVNWIGAGTVAEAMARLKEKSAASRPGSWLIVAGGWTEQQFAEKRRPTLAEVLAAAPDNPVYIQLFYAAVLVTPKAQAALNLNTESLSSAAPGITVERDAAGGATGWWTGNIIAVSALFDRLPKPTYADNVDGTRQFFAELNRLGVTGIIDTGGFNIAAPQYAALFQLWREKSMTVRVAWHLFAQKPGIELDEFKAPTQMMPMGFGDEMLKFNGIGERITLAMYNNNFPNDDARAKFFDVIRWAAEQRLAVTIHWSEATSVGTLLELFERIDREVTPIAPLRWSIAHLENASPQTLARMAALGVGWTMQMAMYYGGDREIAARGDAARRMPPVVTALKAGVHVGAGTDAHRVASYNPFVVLQWLLDGRTVAGTPQRVADEIPTREQALRLYTQGSAWFSFDENKRGSIELGKLADFAILDQDFFAVPVERIGRTVSLITVVGGKVVHATKPFDR